MNVKPCKVMYEGQRYQIESNGAVYLIQLVDGTWVRADGLLPVSDSLSKKVRQHASRLRRNRNARERNQAMRDLGMKRTPYGCWE